MADIDCILTRLQEMEGSIHNNSNKETKEDEEVVVHVPESNDEDRMNLKEWLDTVVNEKAMESSQLYCQQNSFQEQISAMRLFLASVMETRALWKKKKNREDDEEGSDGWFEHMKVRTIKYW